MQMRTLKRALALTLLLLLGLTSRQVFAQNYDLRLTQDVSQDTLYLTLKAFNTDANDLVFGTSNFVIEVLDTTDIEFLSASIDETGDYNAGDYNPQTLGKSTAGGLFRFVMNIQQNTFPAYPAGGFVVASGDSSLIGVIAVPIRSCGNPIAPFWRVAGSGKNLVKDFWNGDITANATFVNPAAVELFPVFEMSATTVASGTVDEPYLLSGNVTSIAIFSTIASAETLFGFDSVEVDFGCTTVGGHLDTLYAYGPIAGCYDSLLITVNPHATINGPINVFAGQDSLVYETSDLSLVDFALISDSATTAFAPLLATDSVYLSFECIYGAGEVDTLFFVDANGCTDSVYINVFSAPSLISYIDTVESGNNVIDSVGYANSNVTWNLISSIGSVLGINGADTVSVDFGCAPVGGATDSLIFSNAFGCGDTAVITVNPQVAFVLAPTVVLAGSPDSLFVVSIDANWDDSSNIGSDFDGLADLTANDSVYYDFACTYLTGFSDTLFVVDTFGVCTDTAIVDVAPADTLIGPATLFAGQDSAIYSSQGSLLLAELNVTLGLAFQGDTLSNVGGDSLYVDYTCDVDAGFDTISIASVNGCVDTLIVLVVPADTIVGPSVVTAGADGIVFSTELGSPLFVANYGSGTSTANSIVQTNVDSLTIDFVCNPVVSYDSLVYIDANGCNDTLDVTVNPSISITAGSATVSAGTSAVGYSSSEPGAWSFDDADTIAIYTAPYPNNANVLVDFRCDPMGGVDTIRVTNSTATCFDTVVVTVNPSIAIINPGTDTTICGTQSYGFVSNFSGNWGRDNGGNANDGEAYTGTATPGFAIFVPLAGVQVDTIWVTDGICSDSVEVDADSIPQIGVIRPYQSTPDTADFTTCALDSFQFVNTLGSNVDWKHQQGVTGTTLRDSLSSITFTTPFVSVAQRFDTIIATEGFCGDTMIVEVLPGGYLDLSVVLQGAYVGPAVQRDSLSVKGYLNVYSIQDTNALPLVDATPTYKSYVDSLEFATGGALEDVVDVLEITLRDGGSATGAVVGSGFGYLLADGSVTDYETGAKGVMKTCGATGSVYVVVEHRNHLGVQSATPVVLSAAAPVSFDFTQIANIYGGGAFLVAPTTAALVAGDSRREASYEVNANDMYDVSRDEVLLPMGYEPSDVDLSGDVNAADRNLTSQMNDLLYWSTIP